jgi:DNA-binding HxlR family transcriptional regulator
MVFTYQQWKKLESQQRILNALSDSDKSFADLLEETELSKPILSKRLKSLMKQGKIEHVPDVKNKRFLYRLVHESLDVIEKALVMLHDLSNYVVANLEKFAVDPAIDDEEYARRLTEGTMILFNFKMLEHFIAPKHIQEGYLKVTLGLEFVKKMPKLFPKNREVLPYIFANMTPSEQTIYKSEEIKKAANRIIEYLNPLIEKLRKK